MLSNHKPPLWMEVNIVFLHGHANGIVFSWLFPNLSQIVWKRIGMTRIIYQLFEGHEYAKLGLDENDFPQAWDFWNPSSHPLRNSPLQKG